MIYIFVKGVEIINFISYNLDVILFILIMINLYRRRFVIVKVVFVIPRYMYMCKKRL